MDMKCIQDLLGHASTKTTEICTHVSNRAIEHIVNPIDKLFLKTKYKNQM